MLMISSTLDNSCFTFYYYSLQIIFSEEKIFVKVKHTVENKNVFIAMSLLHPMVPVSLPQLFKVRITAGISSNK